MKHYSYFDVKFFDKDGYQVGKAMFTCHEGENDSPEKLMAAALYRMSRVPKYDWSISHKQIVETAVFGMVNFAGVYVLVPIPPEVTITKEQYLEDAERWRALVSCDRIRILGTGGLGKDNQHIGLEVWDKYPGTHPDGSVDLTKFVDTIRSRKMPK